MADSGGAAAHEPDSVPMLIARYREDAYRLARHLVRSPAEAEDLAHTAILNVLRRADNISDSDHVRAYLMTAVRNAWRNQLRARGGRRFLGADYAESMPSSDLAPDEIVLTGFDTAIARLAFESLSPTSRQVIQLRYLDGLSFPEVAARLAISSVAARQRAHRAREELVGACMEHAASEGTGDCKSVRLRLGRYHRGLLNRRTRAALELHLSRCAVCQSCYDEVVDLYGHRINRTAQSGDLTDD
jgi:RNA polymerase sigma factor (sigma-70 family)